MQKYVKKKGELGEIVKLSKKDAEALEKTQNEQLIEINKQTIIQSRRLSYENGDYIDALMKDALDRQEGGEGLHPELKTALEHWSKVKEKYPKK